MSLFMALAITANAQLNFGVKAGLNVSSFSGFKEFHEEEDGYSRDVEQGNKPGFHLGVDVQYMFTPQLGIESGLFYSTLGTKVTGTGKYRSSVYKTEVSINPSYLQIPVSILYKFDLGQDLYIYPSAGLYFGCGLGGKMEEKTGEEKRSLDLFSKLSESDNVADELVGEVIANRFDVGLNVGLTLQYSNFTVGLGYEQGLSSLLNGKLFNEEEGYIPNAMKDSKNRNFKVSVGYFF